MLLLALLFIMHFVGDFICQSRWMAENKGKDPLALTVHVLCYSAIFLIGLNYMTYLTEHLIVYFVIFNAILHWVTDLCSSQFTSYFKAEGNNYGFFSTIGADQLVHHLTIMLLAHLVLGINL